jgi:ribulose-5-phosphate 4-epimerase/fuculose-1-phosphate aldolase
MPASGADDAAFLADVGERVMQIQFDAESLTGAERDEQVIQQFKSLEAAQQP